MSEPGSHRTCAPAGLLHGHRATEAASAGAVKTRPGFRCGAGAMPHVVGSLSGAAALSPQAVHDELLEGAHGVLPDRGEHTASGGDVGGAALLEPLAHGVILTVHLAP